MATLSSYLQKWKLKLSITKTVTSAFHLNNKEARRELQVSVENRILPFSAEPTYLGVKLDRSLTYRHHLESLLLRRMTEILFLTVRKNQGPRGYPFTTQVHQTARVRC